MPITRIYKRPQGKYDVLVKPRRGYGLAPVHGKALTKDQVVGLVKQVADEEDARRALR